MDRSSGRKKQLELGSLLADMIDDTPEMHAMLDFLPKIPPAICFGQMIPAASRLHAWIALHGKDSR